MAELCPLPHLCTRLGSVVDTGTVAHPRVGLGSSVLALTEVWKHLFLPIKMQLEFLKLFKQRLHDHSNAHGGSSEVRVTGIRFGPRILH